MIWSHVVRGSVFHLVSQARSSFALWDTWLPPSAWSRAVAHSFLTSPLVLHLSRCRALTLVRRTMIWHAFWICWCTGDSSSRAWNAATLLSKYRSSGGVYVSVSSVAIGVARYAPAIVRRHLFWISCNLAVTSLILETIGVCYDDAPYASYGRTTKE